MVSAACHFGVLVFASFHRQSLALQASNRKTEQLQDISMNMSRTHVDNDKDVNAAFLRKYKCDAEPTLTAAFKRLDANGYGTIHSSDLPTAFSWENALAEFTIKGGRAEETGRSPINEKWATDREEQYQHMLNDILKEVQVPDMKLLVRISDWAYLGPGSQYVLSNDGRPGSDLLFLPRSLIDWGDSFHAVPHGDCKEKKKNIAVFRGSSTGAPWVYNASRPLPLRDRAGVVGLRYRAANLSKHRPDLLDAGFTKVQDSPHFYPDRNHTKYFEIALRKEGLIKGFLNDYEQHCFSAVVVIDGHAQADRLPRQMMYGIPVIVIHEQKKATPLWHTAASTHPETWQDEFWYGEPRNGKDWLMISIGELEETLENLLSDPAKMAMLGRNARSYVQERLSKRRVKCYMYSLLTEYGKRYRQ